MQKNPKEVESFDTHQEAINKKKHRDFEDVINTK